MLREKDVKSQAIGTSPSRHFEIQNTTGLAIQRNGDTIEITIENMQSVTEKTNVIEFFDIFSVLHQTLQYQIRCLHDQISSFKEMGLFRLIFFFSFTSFSKEKYTCEQARI